MGDMADDMFDMELDMLIRDSNERRWYRTQGYWTTLDGRKIKFEKLEDTHLIHIDRMLRRAKCISQWPEITKEIKKRGFNSDTTL